MKKSLIIIISTIIALGAVVAALYYTSKPSWSYSYTSQDYIYLEENLHHYDEDGELYFRGTLWVKFASYGSNNFHIYPVDSDLDIQLPLISKEVFDIDLSNRNGDVYPIFLSLNFKQENAGFFNNILCNYIGKDFCQKGLKLKAWSVYENTFPFPELSEQESYELVDNTLSLYLDENSNYSCDFVDFGKGADIARMIYNGNLVVGENWDATEWDRSYMMINMMDEQDSGYNDVLDYLCSDLAPLYESYLKNIVKEITFVDYITVVSMDKYCATEIERSVKFPDLDMDLDSRDNIYQSLHCSYGNMDGRCDTYMEEVLDSGLFSSLNVSSVLEDGTYCSEDLFYNLRLYLNERVQNL